MQIRVETVKSILTLLCVCVCVCVSAAWKVRWSTASSTAHHAVSASRSPTTCTAAWRTWCSTTTRPPWCSTTTRSTCALHTPSTHRCPLDADEPHPPSHTPSHRQQTTSLLGKGVWAEGRKEGGRGNWLKNKATPTPDPIKIETN